MSEKKNVTEQEVQLQAGKNAAAEQSKAEMLKIVEGMPGAERLSELLERGKKKGNLSSSELMEVLEEMNLESEQMDRIYDTMENLGIDTVGEDYMPDLNEVEMPPAEEIEELSEEEKRDMYLGSDNIF